MSHALRADRLLIKPTAGARPASPCTPGRFIPKARNRGLTPDEPRATRTTTSLATAPDGPTKRHLQTPDEPRATRTTTSLATAPDGPTKRHLQTPEHEIPTDGIVQAY